MVNRKGEHPVKHMPGYEWIYYYRAIDKLEENPWFHAVRAPRLSGGNCTFRPRNRQ